MDEVEPTVMLSVRVPQALHRRVKLRVVETDRQIVTFVVEALEAALARVPAERAA